MAHDERQRRMLEWMGIRLWEPPAAPGADVAAAAAASALPAAPTVVARAEGAGTASAASAPAVPLAPGVAAEPAGAGMASDRPIDSAVPIAPVAGPLDVAPGLAFGDGAGVASMDWPALREAVSACRACGLCNSRRHTVFGVGHERAHWMIVGEAPGEQEDLQGAPFVGPAGQLLDAMLHSVGLTREAAEPERQVFITNTLKCRPPRNRNPAPEEMAQCEPYLQRQIALVRPRLILAMGRFAVQSLLRSTAPLGKLRGQVHRYQGIPLIVTYHPAYLLRNPVDKAKSWEDLCLAASLAASLPPV